MPTPRPTPAIPSAQPVPAATHEVVGLFPTARAMEEGVQDLLTSGFDHGDIAILADRRVVESHLGHRLEDTRAAADDPAVPRRAWIEPESRMEGRSALAAALGYVGAVTAIALTFATGGAAVAAIGGAVFGGGAGASLGAVLGRLFDRRLARQIENQIALGGILVWVRCAGPDAERRAGAALARHRAADVHVHRPPG